MKNLYTFILFSLTFGATAQVNWEFQDWTNNATYNDPDGWLTINQYASILGIDPPVEKDTLDSIYLNFDAKLITRACPNCNGFNLPDTLPGQIVQNIPYTTVPQSVFFSYKYEPQGNDVAVAYFELTRWDAVGDSTIIVASALDTISATTSWQVKNPNFIISDPGTPDTLNIIFLSSVGTALGAGWPSAKDGSALYIDHIYTDAMVNIDRNEKSDIDLITIIDDNQLKVVTSEKDATIQLIDLSGKIIFNKSITNNTSYFNVSGLPNGIYLVRLNSKQGIKTNKIIIH
jgi:hypothetical protein